MAKKGAYRKLLGPEFISDQVSVLADPKFNANYNVAFLQIHNTSETDSVSVKIYDAANKDSVDASKEIVNEELEPKKTIFIEYPQDGYRVEGEDSNLYAVASVSNAATVVMFGYIDYGA